MERITRIILSIIIIVVISSRKKMSVYLLFVGWSRWCKERQTCMITPNAVNKNKIKMCYSTKTTKVNAAIKPTNPTEMPRSISVLPSTKMKSNNTTINPTTVTVTANNKRNKNQPNTTSLTNNINKPNPSKPLNLISKHRWNSTRIWREVCLKK